MVSFDPVALQKGATAYTGKAEAIRGHATTVADLDALRDAFGELGAPVWQFVKTELDRIQRTLLDSIDRATKTGTAMGIAGTGATTIDQDHQTTIRNTGR